MTARRPTAGAAALAVVVTGAAAFIAFYGLRDHLALPDEAQVVSGGRYLEAHFPAGFFASAPFPRGPERLTAMLAWVANVVAPSTPREFQGYHLLVALAYALTAVPVYALSRGLGARPWAAVVPAALVVVGPWAVFGTTLLDGGVGMLAAACFALAAWRALVAPGLRSDAWLLTAIALLALARTGNVPLVAAFPVALLVLLWRDREASQSALGWLRGLPRTVVQRHPLLCAVAVLTLAVVVVRGVDVLLGGSSYGGVRTGEHVSPGGLWDELHAVIAKLAWATGLVPVMLGGAWLVRQVVLPTSQRDGAFAVLAVAMLAAFLYAYALSYDEERYVLPLLPLVAVAFGRAAFSVGVGWLAALVGAAVVGRLVATAPALPDLQARLYLFAPGQGFFDRVLGGRLAEHGLGGHTALVAFLVAGAAALALRLRGRLRGPWPAVVVGIVLTALAAHQIAGASWAMRKNSIEATGAGQTFAQQAFVDEVVGGPDGTVPLLANNPTGDPQLSVAFEQLAFFNRRVDRARRVQLVGAGSSPCCVPGARVVRIDPATGRARAEGGPPPERYVARTGFRDVALVADVVATTPSFPLVLEHPRRPLQAAYAATGTVQGGWAAPGRPTRIRVYAWGGRPRPACLVGTVVAPSAGSTGVDWSIDGRSGRSVAGTLAPGAAQPLRVRLPARTATLRLYSGTGTLPGGARTGVTLQDARVERC